MVDILTYPNFLRYWWKKLIYFYRREECHHIQ